MRKHNLISIDLAKNGRMPAPCVLFTDSKDLLTNMCEKLGGTVKIGIKDSEVKFYLKDSVNCDLFKSRQ